MPASIKIGYLPSYTASNLVSMEGFCILWAGKLVIGSAVSSCAKCRQETKMWTLVIGTPLYLVRISWFLLRGEMELSQLEMISGRGGASSRIATNPFRFTLNSVSLRLPSIHLETPAPHQNHVPSHILSIGVRKLGREASEARQSKPTDENQSLQMKWTKSFGSTTIRWNERKWPEENWGSQASLNLPRLSQCFPQAIIGGKWNENFVWERSYILLYRQSWEL